MSSTAKYKNFYLVVTAHDGKYFVHVADSPVGESRDVCEFIPPFADAEIQHILLRLENAILRNVRAVRSAVLHGDLHKDLHEMGDKLFKALLVQPGPIQRLYADSRLKLDKTERLRVKLRIEPPLLGALPWEYFYDSVVLKDYVGLHAQSSLVRFMQLPDPVETLSVQGPLRILGMVASPQDESDPRHLNATNERTRIDKALQGLHAEGAVHFQWVRGETKIDLYELLTEGEWHVFHFIGHGGVAADEGFLEMGGEAGRPVKAFGKDLKRLFGLQSTLRLVILNCCDSAHGHASLAKELVEFGIPAVLAMQFPISDAAAIEFAGAFYDALAKGEPVDGAVTRARIRIQANTLTSMEWGIPVLYMRAPDGHIFERQVSPGASAHGSATVVGLPRKTNLAGLTAVDPCTPQVASTPNFVPPQGAATLQLGLGSFEDLVESLDPPLPPGTAEFLRDINLEALTIKDLNGLLEKGNQLLSAGGSGQVRCRLARIHYQLGVRYQNDSSLSQAFVNFSSAIEIDSTRPEFLYARANIFARTQRYDAGAADLNRAIGIDPRQGDLHWAKGVIYLLASRTPGGSDQLKAAIEAFSVAIDCNPHVAKYFSSRGAARSRSGEPDAALLDLDEALRLDSNDARTYYNRAHLRRQQGNDAGAREDLQRAAELGSAEAIAQLHGGGMRH